MNQDRVAVVTGGASGIGLGICKLFAASGHPVVMLDLQDELLERESAAIRATGGKILARKVDVSKREEIDAAYAEARRQFGPISIVIANAGYSRPEPFVTMTFESWKRMMEVTLDGAFHSIQAAVPDMIARKWGRIVTITSNAAQSGAPDRANYSAAKGGVVGFTRSLARELGGLGITANTIPPALVDTPLARKGVENGEVPPLEVIAQHVPIPRVGTPEDIAAACEFLCSDGASYITGQQLNVNGGIYM